MAGVTDCWVKLTTMHCLNLQVDFDDDTHFVTEIEKGDSKELVADKLRDLAVHILTFKENKPE